MSEMAEPGTGINVVASDCGASEDDDSRARVPTPRPLALAGIGAAVSALFIAFCCGLFNAKGQVSPSAVLIAVALLTVCLSVSRFERGLYSLPKIINRVMPILRLRLRGGRASVNKTVIIGEPAEIHDLLQSLRDGVPRTFDVIGVVIHPGDAACPLTGDSLFGLPRFDGIDTLERMIRQGSVGSVVVAMPWWAREQTRAIIQRVSMTAVDLYVCPGMNGLGVLPGGVPDFPLRTERAKPSAGWRPWIRRAEDIALSAGLLAVVSPVMLTIALVIKFTSPGPVLIRQCRPGHANRIIKVWTFRSTYVHPQGADATRQALGGECVTPAGAWLRHTGMAELPQLFNVLRGDLSLVGYRSHRDPGTTDGSTLAAAVRVYPSRYRAKSGISG